MYTLRIVYKDKTEENIYLGKCYRVITQDSDCFKTLKEESGIITDNLYKFVVVDGGENHVSHFLFLDNKNYIVSENGSTFARL